MTESVIARLAAEPEECFFWATQAGAELDLLVVRGPRRLGFEFKRTDSPKTTRSMWTAIEDLELDSLTVVHAGEHRFPLGENITAVPARTLPDVVRPVR